MKIKILGCSKTKSNYHLGYSTRLGNNPKMGIYEALVKNPKCIYCKQKI